MLLLMSGGLRDQRQESSSGRCKIPAMLVLHCKISLKQGIKILDDDMTVGNTEAGFVQIPCPNTLLVAFSCVLASLEVKF